MNRCEECRHWEGDKENPERSGLCMRYPPVVFMTWSGAGPKTEFKFPSIRGNEKCGEFKSIARYSDP